MFEFCTSIQNIELVVTIDVGCEDINSGFRQNKQEEYTASVLSIMRILYLFFVNIADSMRCGRILSKTELFVRN